MKILKKVICILISVTQANATTILLAGEGTKTSDFHRFVTRQENAQTYIQWLRNKEQNNAAQSQIREKFIDAKAYLLKGDYEKAKAAFHEIIAAAYTYDWPSPQRSLITHAFLALAEISSTTSEKKYWVTKSVAFSLGEITEPQTLSQNIQEMIRDVLKSAKSLELSLKILNAWDLVLLNGREIKSTELQKYKILPENYRLTFLSNRYLPYSEIFHSNQISKIEPTTTFIAAGSCDNPKLQTSHRDQVYHVLFLETCEREWNKNWIIKVQNNFLPNYNITQSNMDFSEKPTRSSSKWFWGAALVVGIAVIVANQKTSRTETHPPKVEDAED